MPNGRVGKVVSIIESTELFGDVRYMVRDWYDDLGPFKTEELHLSDKPLKKQAPKQLSMADAHKALGTESNNKKTTTYQMPAYDACSHNLDPFPLPDGKTLYLSASRDARGEKSAGFKDPTSGIYLDPSWQSISGTNFLTNTGMLDGGSKYRVTFVRWPDMRAIEHQLLDVLLAFIHMELQNGETVEFGCIGGHGRTGSLAAAVLIGLYDMDAKDAIAYVRKHHCKKAVESVSQEKMLYELSKMPYPETKERKGGEIDIAWEDDGIAWEDDEEDNERN
jgi:hypothetical protein